MNILALDYGTKRIGLALVNTELKVVVPFGVVENQNDQDQQLAKIVRGEKIDRIVVGLPMGLKGEAENDHVKNIRAFGARLEKLFNIPIEFFDERFSSLAADQRGGSVSRDERSAMVILEDYLRRSSI